MDCRILGPLEVERDGTLLSLGSGRQLALVAVLLLHRNEVVSVDRLVEELWDGSPPPTAAKVVRNNVSLLRKELGVLFQAVDDVIDGDGYAAALGVEGARDVAASAAGRAHVRLEAIDADTSVLAEIVDELAVRTA